MIGLIYLSVLLSIVILFALYFIGAAVHKIMNEQRELHRRLDLTRSEMRLFIEQEDRYQESLDERVGKIQNHYSVLKIHHEDLKKMVYDSMLKTKDNKEILMALRDECRVYKEFLQDRIGSVKAKTEVLSETFKKTIATFNEILTAQRALEKRQNKKTISKKRRKA